MPAETQRKAFAPFQVKANDDDARTITGLASTWDLDLGGDVIHRGAFKKTLSDWKGSKRLIPLIDQHGYHSVRQVVGKLVDAKETAEGLEATFEVIDGPDGDEIYRRVKGGYIDGLSIGYRAVKTEEPNDDERRRGVWRHLKEVKLEEVSVVIWPMNPEARIDSVKELIEGIRTGSVTDEDRRILVELKDALAALPATPAEPTKADKEPEPTGAATPEQVAELKFRMSLLNLRKPASATR